MKGTYYPLILICFAVIVLTECTPTDVFPSKFIKELENSIPHYAFIETWEKEIILSEDYCQTDQDCVIDYFKPGYCCPSKCTPYPMNITTSKQFEKWRNIRCNFSMIIPLNDILEQKKRAERLSVCDMKKGCKDYPSNLSLGCRNHKCESVLYFGSHANNSAEDIALPLSIDGHKRWEFLNGSKTEFNLIADFCATDQDCILEEYRPGNCCIKPCSLPLPMSINASEELNAWRRRNCVVFKNAAIKWDGCFFWGACSYPQNGMPQNSRCKENRCVVGDSR